MKTAGKNVRIASACAATQIVKCKHCGGARWRHYLRCAAVDYISCPKGFAARKGKG